MTTDARVAHSLHRLYCDRVISSLLGYDQPSITTETLPTQPKTTSLRSDALTGITETADQLDRND